MLVHITRKLVVIAVVTAFGLSALAQQPAAGGGQQPNWKDRAEYDLYESITKAQDPNKKIELLNQWKEKYPTSDYKTLRLGMIFATYQQMNNAQKMLDTAKEIVAADPKNMQGLFFIAFLTPALNQTAPDALDSAEKAANSLLANLDATYAAEKKPAQVSEENWKKERANVEGQSHATLGWVAQQKKNLEPAEAEYKKSLQINPANGQVSLWLGQTILAQKKPEKQSEAVYQFARTAVYDGPGGLTEPVRKQMDQYLVKVYSQLHGDQSGLDELRATAKAHALPPEGFKIKTSAEIASEKEEEFKKTNPMLALWMSVKKELAGSNGAAYFDSNLKGAALPGGAQGVERFTGKLISAKPAVNPKELVLGIADPNTAEVTLKLDNPMRGKAEPGIEIGFDGIASAFTPDPFNLTFDVEKDKVTGWKAAPPPAPVKKAAGGAKKGGAKKK